MTIVPRIVRIMSVWHGVATDFLKFYSGLPRPTLSRPAGGLPLKLPYGRFRPGLTTGRPACGRLLHFWTPHAYGLGVTMVPRIVRLQASGVFAVV